MVGLLPLAPHHDYLHYIHHANGVETGDMTDALNIISVPRFQNQEAYLLANVASKLIPSENFTPDFFLVELIFRPSIPDNIFACFL